MWEFWVSLSESEKNFVATPKMLRIGFDLYDQPAHKYSKCSETVSDGDYMWKNTDRWEVCNHAFRLCFKKVLLTEAVRGTWISFAGNRIYVVANSYFQKHIQNFCSSEDNKYKIKCTHNYCKSCWCSAVSTCVGYSGEKVLLVKLTAAVSVTEWENFRVEKFYRHWRICQGSKS